jgi:hypothetical protein
MPTDGLMTDMGCLPAEEVAVHWLDEWFETHARPWLRPMLKALGLEPLEAWFSVSYWPCQSHTEDDYEKLVLRAASVVPELELALRGGRLGLHVRRVVLPSPGGTRSRTAKTT